MEKLTSCLLKLCGFSKSIEKIWANSESPQKCLLCQNQSKHEKGGNCTEHQKQNKTKKTIQGSVDLYYFS